MQNEIEELKNRTTGYATLKKDFASLQRDISKLKNSNAGNSTEGIKHMRT
jgi:hypothetical protein